MLGEPTCGSSGSIAAINLRRPAKKAKQSAQVASEQGGTLSGRALWLEFGNCRNQELFKISRKIGFTVLHVLKNVQELGGHRPNV